MYLSKKPQPPKYTLAPFLFLNVVSLMNGELFSTSSMVRLYVTLLWPGDDHCCHFEEILNTFPLGNIILWATLQKMGTFGSPRI